MEKDTFNSKEIKALVSLLEDDDKEILAHVEKKILNLGNIMIPFLETEWESNFNPDVQRRIEDLLHSLQMQNLKSRLHQWKDTEQDNLLKGVYLIATFQYPDLDVKKVRKDLDKIFYEIWLNHRSYSSPSDQVRNFNNIFFNKFGFVANTQNFHSASNSMINSVLETRKGNPVLLCVIYLLIAQKLGMPVFGVNLPNLFVLTYKSKETQFYINVFNKGSIFSKTDIDNYLSQLRLEKTNIFYDPCDNLAIVHRILRNLVLSFEKLNENEKMEEIKNILKVLGEVEE